MKIIIQIKVFRTEKLKKYKNKIGMATDKIELTERNMELNQCKGTKLINILIADRSGTDGI